MKIIFERGIDGEILSLETITEKEGILSDGERAQLQMFYDEELKKLKEKHAHEQKAYIHEEKLRAIEAQEKIQTTITKSTEEMSKASSNTFASFLNAVGSVALAACYCSEQPNQLPQNTQPTKKVN